MAPLVMVPLVTTSRIMVSRIMVSRIMVSRIMVTRIMLTLIMVGACDVGMGQAQSPAASTEPAGTGAAVRFRDVSRESGLIPAAAGLQAHGAGWGDVDRNGWPDLYVGTFHYQGTQPGLLLRNDRGRMTRDPQPALSISTRATGVLLVDFDNDGDLDLYVAGMPAAEGSRLASRLGYALRGCSLLENLGDGRFRDLTDGNGACPQAFGGRSATAADFDGDGLLDLLVGEDPLPGYNGSTTRRSRVFRNLGDLRFRDATDESGLPNEAAGLGVAVGDINRDGWPDLCLASTLGCFIMLNDRQGRFTECPGSRETLSWPAAKGDDMVCGVALADVNRDGLLDVVLGQHFSQPWVEPVSNRLYLQRSSAGGDPVFNDVTDHVGLVPLPMKAPHIEVQDFDNDGAVDLMTSIVFFAQGRPHPVIFQNRSLPDGRLRFAAPALTVNDFPTEQDRAQRRSGPFFEKMLQERKVFYAAPAPSADFDRDGRLDLFVGSWWSERESLLLKNETPAGNWLNVSVTGSGRLNRMGIGARVELYEAGKSGQPGALLGCREIATGFGYASSQEASAHFGLGERTQCDLLIRVPFSMRVVRRDNVAANQRLTVEIDE